MTKTEAFPDDPLEFLGRTVQQFAETYRGLLTQSAPVEHCQEAGRTFRDVFGQYCRTLNSAMDSFDDDADEDEAADDPTDNYEDSDDDYEYE